jgi:hypothetical protein
MKIPFEKLKPYRFGAARAACTAARPATSGARLYEILPMARRSGG